MPAEPILAEHKTSTGVVVGGYFIGMEIACNLEGGHMMWVNSFRHHCAERSIYSSTAAVRPVGRGSHGSFWSWKWETQLEEPTYHRLPTSKHSDIYFRSKKITGLQYVFAYLLLYISIYIQIISSISTSWRVEQPGLSLVIEALVVLPSGKRTVDYGKSPFWMGKSTKTWAMFDSYKITILKNGQSTY